ncbi:MAG TPA: acetamidase/formamidase family protein, partial [Actinomycetota bacterium]|nr:acetamidase/formamidase family protein [Actinomycetota bacterium]
MAGLNVVSFRPERGDYAWTFGGVDPVMKVKPGDVLEIWTDDCFGGLVESVDDLPSKKITAFNPQTGPFYVEGAEPGDTLALHFVSIEPSRDWAVSTTFPLFGALTSTTRTVTLQDPLPELVW